MPAPLSPSVYISYDPSDERWKETIASRLRDSKIQVSYPAPGGSGSDRLLSAQNDRVNARVFLLLVSPRFLKRDDIFKIEFPHIQSLVHSGRAQIIFVVIESCPWRNQLTSPQVASIVIPREDRALAEEDSKQLKDDLDTLVEEVVRAFERLNVSTIPQQQEITSLPEDAEEPATNTPSDSIQGDAAPSRRSGRVSTKRKPDAFGKTRMPSKAPEDVKSKADEVPKETPLLTILQFTERCKRVLVAAAGYTRNRRQRQQNSLTTTSILYALIDFALLGRIDADDATRVIGNAVREAGVEQYQDRRKNFLKEQMPVTVFDSEPLSNALTNVSINTRTLIVAAQEIARQTTATTTPVDPATLPIDTRHLIAAMFTAFPQGRQRSGQLQLLSLLGLQVPSLENALYSFVSEHFSSTDFLDKWSEVLKVLPSDIPAEIEKKQQGTFEPLIAGYVSDSTKSPEDDLDIGHDVQTLCSVILAREVLPPLSIGLFGDWGTGKTFFMDRMREEIDFVKKQTGNPTYSKFHTRVAQITFNAWHYVDASLWASLVSHILEKLVEEIAPRPDEVTVRKKLVKELQTAKELKAEAEQERQRAANEREAAENRLSEVAEQRAQKQMELSSLRATDLWQFVKDDGELKRSIDTALQSLGVPSMLNSLEDLDAVALDARGVSGRIYSLGVSLVRDGSRVTLLLLIATLLLAVPGLAWLLSYWLPRQPFVATLSSIGTGVTAVCLAVSSALRGPLRRVNECVDRLEEARKKALDLIKQKRIERSDQETKLEGEVNTLKAKEVSATQQLSAADARVREVESKIHEIDEGRNLAKFILARSEAGDYRKHLGLISTIRQDFENLSKLLQIAAAGETGDGAVQRIVLYVDDLDRCPSARVVELLEAVHLLLAFDLFVVVVGVDPRWLLHSLQQKFSAFQAGIDKSVAGELDWVTTPQDYLEKIFQIPFSLQRMESNGFSKLMRRLLPETTAPASQRSEPTQSVIPASLETPLVSAGAIQPTRSNPVSHLIEGETPSGSAGATEDTAGMNRRLNQDSLNIRSWEAQFASQLSAFVPTPRSAKRFTNIYRLLKAPLDPGQLSIFEGQKASPGEFRAPMLLLAILTGFPHLSVALFGAITQQDPATVSARDFFVNVASHSEKNPEAARLQDCLDPLLEAALPDSFEPFMRWAPRVARFSFYTAKVAELKIS
jgi:hypothetical protein